ncbi:MAG TPA: cell surface protein SprA [Saprospiraceae bacterium]|nr:cell surface protein SprA [Saprospiraceae bacterium]
MRFDKILGAIAVAVLVYFNLCASGGYNLENPYSNESITQQDTIPTRPIGFGNNFGNNNNPFDIEPTSVTKEVSYDPTSNSYIITEKIGEEYYKTPTYMTFNEYMEWSAKEREKEYFNNLAGIYDPKKSNFDLDDPMNKVDIQKNLVDRLFGGSEINIQPQGNVDISLGANYNRFDGSNFINYNSPWRVPDIDMKIRMSVDGAIGKKMKLNFNYDTQATFDFDQKIKLSFDSEQFSEDDIIKKIEAGNVDLPLKSNLIQGSQSLFGLKTELQFGRLRLTALASQQRSEQNSIKIENGASLQEFELRPEDYDENRHFFVSRFNREQYEKNLQFLPYVPSPFKITRMEVWVSEDRPDNRQQTRMVVALADLGTGRMQDLENPNMTYLPTNVPPIYKVDTLVLPDNDVSDFYKNLIANQNVQDVDKVSRELVTNYNLTENRDFEIFQGRLLNPSEYTYNEKLGYISLNLKLRPNQRMGVVYEYYYNEKPDSVFTVGDFYGAEQVPSSADLQQDSCATGPTKIKFIKMLKSSVQNPTLKSWDLMMKNVYSLRTSQLSRDNFEFDIYFEDYDEGNLKKFIPSNPYKPLLQIFHLDTLNQFGDPQPDGIFDFVPGVTVNERNGVIFFPVLEPFGTALSETLNPADYLKYGYPELYNQTLTQARNNIQSSAKNRFRMIAKVKSATAGEINLGPFVPRGSVRVTAGSKTLIENVDYEIDYSLGRLRIINPAYLVQGTPINVNFEDNTTFSLQQKTMLGLRADYRVSKKVNLGATYLRLQERPLTQKVQIGDDPINNRIFGLDINYADESNFLTRLVDKLPFYSTKETSRINFSAEGAALKPGSNDVINIKTASGSQGTVLIDDFEGAINGFLLGGYNSNQWALASVPPEIPGSEIDGLESGANRALLNWYTIDRAARRGNDNSDPYARTLEQTALFPGRSVQPGQGELFTFDVSYYPNERGPYNFDVPDGYPGISSGITVDGQQQKVYLNDPESRWGGIMRYFPNSDFEAANYEFIEFWLLNPFMDRQDGVVPGANESGEIVMQLGNISEDILKDGKQFFENGLVDDPNRCTNYDQSVWGVVPQNIPLNNNFNNQNLDTDPTQDYGLDGLNDTIERAHFNDWLAQIGGFQYNFITEDPSNDDYLSNNDPAYDNVDVLTERYKKFNNPQGNFPNNRGTTDPTRLERGNFYPDQEDLNLNRALDQGESYYEYRIPIKNNNGELDINIPGSRVTQVKIDSTNNRNDKWYRVLIPLNSQNSIYGNIQGFRSIQFMRMYMTHFQTAKTFRMAEFQLVRNQWRKNSVVCNSTQASPYEFSVDEVGIEENSDKLPFNYISPPEVQREQIQSTYSNLFQDEKSMAIKAEDFPPCTDISVSKLLNLDLTFYDRLQLVVHAEHPLTEMGVKDGDMSLFIRIGKDYTDNYYEYEIPLIFSNGKGNANNPDIVWLDQNRVDIPLADFVNLKEKRIRTQIPLSDVIDSLVIDPAGGFTKRYSMKGNPSLGYVKQIYIGLRNNTQVPKTTETWINELRVTGLKQKGGYAAQAKLQVAFADLMEINAAANYSSVGWGALDQRLQERNRKEEVGYDLVGTVKIDKFFPEKAKLNIPMYVQYTREESRLQYDPYEQDISVNESKSLAKYDPDKTEQDVADRSRETTTTKSINFTNIKTGVSTKKPFPWSPNNFAFTYAYTETTKTNPLIKEEATSQRIMSMEYNYNTKGASIEPFKFIKVDALKFISNFNLNLLPNRFGFNTKLDDYQGHRTFREPQLPVYRFDDQRYKWDRNYVLDWNLAKSLRLNFKANVNSVVDRYRPYGIADNPDDRGWVNAQGNTAAKDDPAINQYFNDNLKEGGRRKNYTQNLSANYKIPINLLPMLDWVSASADYKTDYAWKAGSLAPINNNGDVSGNIISNTQNIGLNTTFSFEKLYAKSSYLKAIEDGGKSLKRNKRSRRTRTSKKVDTEKKDVSTETDEKKEEEKEKEPRVPSTVERILIRPLLMLRSVKVSFKQDKATMIPGFDREANMLGLEKGFGAPGVDFAFGSQPKIQDVGTSESWLHNNREWFTPVSQLNDPLSQTHSYDYSAKIDLEPFKDFEVDIDMKKAYSENYSEVFKYDGINEQFNDISKYQFGSFDMTYLPIKTLFKDQDELWAQFQNNKKTFSNILAETPNNVDYADGYGANSYQVSIPTFLATYNGDDLVSWADNTVYNQEVKRFGLLPKPNWSLRYDGLSNIPLFKGFVKSFTLNHAYKSNLRVSQFYSQINFDVNAISGNRDDHGNYYASYEIPNVVIDEQFSPLIGIQLKTQSDMSFEFEMRKSRNLQYTVQTRQLQQRESSELVFGFGYTLKNFKGFGKPKKKRTRKSKDGDENTDDGGLLGNDTNKGKDSKNNNVFVKNLIFNMDLSLRTDLTRTRNETGNAESINNSDSGSKSVAINPSIDYEMNKYLTLRLYFDYNRRTDLSGTSTTNTNLNTGITARFILQ